jgi:O-antigen/teichoic acid export membrane protein
MLYALYFVLVVVIGRTGRTEYSFPATVAGTIVNIILNLVLVPPLGIVGAGLALVASYLVLLGVMYVFSQRLFPVQYEWGRVAQVAAIAIGITLAGELLLPTEGIAAWLTRGAALAMYPLLLWVTRFPRPDEREEIKKLLRPGALAERLRAVRAKPAAAGAGVPESFDQEIRDEDRL